MNDRILPSAEFSILVNSCHKYGDTCSLFFVLFWMFWPDCPYSVYQGANSSSYADSRVRMIQVGPDLSWGDTALAMLVAIPTPYVLWFLDDFFIHDPITTSMVAGLFEDDENALCQTPAVATGYATR
jgi:hypothetical protein